MKPPCRERGGGERDRAGFGRRRSYRVHRGRRRPIHRGAGDAGEPLDEVIVSALPDRVSHWLKFHLPARILTVEDLHEGLAGAVPRLRFGIAFCDSSGPRLVRRSGQPIPELVELATATQLRSVPGIRSLCSFVTTFRSMF